MALPTFDATVVSGLKFGDGTVSVTFGATPANGKCIVLAYTQNASGAATRTWPSGFTEVFHEQSGNGQISVAVKMASGESSATYTLGLGDTGDDNQQMRGILFDEVDTTSPVNAISASATNNGFVFNTTVSHTAITTTVNECLLVWLNGPGGDNGVGDGLSATGFTFNSTGSFGERLPFGYKDLGAAGSTGTIDITEATGGNWAAFHAILMALAPTGGGGGLSIPVVMNQYRQRVA